MAHFAEINSETNRVLRVIVVGSEQCAANGGEDSAECEAWVKSFHPGDPTVDTVNAETGKYENISDTFWKRTSVNTYANQHWTDVNPGTREDYPEPEHGADSTFKPGKIPTNRIWPWRLSDTQEKTLRKNYAVVGGLYHSEGDYFSGYKVHPSFLLDEPTGLWWHSVPVPVTLTHSDGREFNRINWNEDELQWKAIMFVDGTEDIDFEKKWNKNTLVWEDI